eukprot:1887400-Alexandrium_andersonii.AAC.1
MGGKWTRYNAMTERWEFLYIRYEYIKTFTEALAGQRMGFGGRGLESVGERGGSAGTGAVGTLTRGGDGAKAGDGLLTVA